MAVNEEFRRLVATSLFCQWCLSALEIAAVEYASNASHKSSEKELRQSFEPTGAWIRAEAPASGRDRSSFTASDFDGFANGFDGARDTTLWRVRLHVIESQSSSFAKCFAVGEGCS